MCLPVCHGHDFASRSARLSAKSDILMQAGIESHGVPSLSDSSWQLLLR